MEDIRQVLVDTDLQGSHLALVDNLQVQEDNLQEQVDRPLQ